MDLSHDSLLFNTAAIATDALQGSTRIFCLGGKKPILKNFLSHAAARKNLFRPSRGSGGMLPRKRLKI